MSGASDDALRDPIFRSVAAWTEDADITTLTLERVSAISQSQGADFAAALLYHRAVTASTHAPAIRQIDETSQPAPSGHDRPHVAIVPGAFHREPMGTDADGRRLEAIVGRLGYRTTIIPSESFGSIPRNAQIINDWLERHQADTVLVCLSKGAAEAKFALLEPNGPAAFRRVRGWINVSGLLNGTPLVQWLSTQRLRTLAIRLVFALRGYQFAVLDQLSMGRGTLLDFDPPLPPGLRVVNLVGFPLASHLTSAMARRQYRRLLPHGPSDGGGILLADACGFPGVLYPVWGADHYLRPRWDLTPLIGRLLRYSALGTEWP